MKNRCALVAVALLLAPIANASYVFSDVKVGTNSVTFTIDGDMTGHAAPPGEYFNQFSIVFSGGLYVGNLSTFGANVWSGSVFDNKSLKYAGNTGGFHSTLISSNQYSWSQYTSSLSDSMASNRTITLSLFDDIIDPLASAGLLEFVWGSGSYEENHTVLEKVSEWTIDETITEPGPDTDPDDPDDPNGVVTIPEPGTLLLLGSGLLAMGASRRRRTA